MCSRRSTRSSRGASRAVALRSQAGFSLIEMLVAILLTGIAMAVFVRDFGFNVKTRRDMDLVAETQQALHATQTFITQELRQAGACLPENGEFIALAANDNGVRDELTLRIGVADETSLTCVASVLTNTENAGDTRMQVQDPTDFEVDDWVYITRLGGFGGTFRVTAVGADYLDISPGLDATYGAGGGVYAIEERFYEVVEVNDVPILAVSIDGGPAQPLVAGVEEFDLRYRAEPCPPCSAVDEPADSAEWRTIREVELRVVTRSTAEKPQGGGYARLESTTTIRPRNLL